MAEAMTEEQRIAEETGRAVRRGRRRLAEKEPTRAAMEVQEMIPSAVYAYAAGASILASLALFLRKEKDWSLFVAQWAPTILLMGIFYKLMKPSGGQQT